MSEQPPEHSLPTDPESPEPEPQRTGVAEVDAVLDSMEGLDEVPLDDHVAVFEGAHDRLRGALDSQPES